MIKNIIKKLAENNMKDQEVSYYCQKIAHMIKVMGCPELDLWKEAARDWNFSNQKINRDFNSHVLEFTLPYYIKLFVDKHYHKFENLRPDCIIS